MNEQQGSDLRQELQQRQGLTLTPRLTQALHILALPLLELAEYARTQVEENPALELGAENSAADTPEQEPAFEQVNSNEANSRESTDDEEWRHYAQNPRDYGADYPAGTYSLQQGGFRPEPSSREEQGLYSLLRLQLATRETMPQLRQAALQIIGHLDEDGYLTLPLPRLAELCGCKEELLAEALVLVQSLDPPGVAARDLRECLRLQIGATEPQRELMLAIIDNHLPEIAKNRARETARALKVPLDQVEQAFARIRALHPRPAAALNSGAMETQYIVPDIIIRKADDGYQAVLNEELEPRLHISAYYRRLAPQLQQDKEALVYLRQKLSAAQALIGNMEKRRQTLTRLAEITIVRQQDFLERGLEHLAPLTMREVADLAGLHESTVSRAVAGKYIQTPRGVYEWKFFFPRAYGTEGGAITPAWVKRQLAELIAHEDKARPYSDSQLCEMLAAQGLRLARRTVAKYREELRLPPRCLRRTSK